MIYLKLSTRAYFSLLPIATAAALSACGGSGGAAPEAAPPQAAMLAQTTISSAVLNAASCNYNDVNTAVQKAGSGMTVQVPAGSCSWGTQQLKIPAGVYLRGAGQDVTTIRRVGAVDRASYLVAYDCSNGKVADFSKMTLVGNGDGTIPDSGLGLLGGCKDFKVSNATFSHFVNSAVFVGDAPAQRGVIAQNRFIDNYSADLKDLGYGVSLSGGADWPALGLGTQNAVYIEDNSFSGNRQSVTSNNGAVFVFRHNTVTATDATKDFYMTDVHGLSTAAHGTRSYEIYDNTFQARGVNGLVRTAISVAGGDGVIFNNTIPAAISRSVATARGRPVIHSRRGATAIRSGAAGALGCPPRTAIGSAPASAARCRGPRRNARPARSRCAP